MSEDLQSPAPTELQRQQWQAELRAMQAEAEDLRPVIHRFVEKVYHQGLARLIEDCPIRGMRGQFGNTELLSYVFIGRVVLTFQTPLGEFAHVTLVGAYKEPDPRMGLHSNRLTVEHAERVINEVIACWPATLEEQRVVFLPFPGAEII